MLRNSLSASTSLMVVIAKLATTSSVYSALFSVPNIAVSSAMACRVFRELKLGILIDEEDVVTLYPRSHGFSFSFSRATKSIPVSIQMTRTVERDEQFDDNGRHTDTKADVLNEV
jgi:hypothetical protein